MTDSSQDFKTRTAQRINKQMAELGRANDAAWLAAQTEIEVGQIMTYLGGFRRLSFERASLIASALGVSLDWLAGRAESKNGAPPTP